MISYLNDNDLDLYTSITIIANELVEIRKLILQGELEVRRRNKSRFKLTSDYIFSSKRVETIELNIPIGRVIDSSIVKNENGSENLTKVYGLSEREVEVLKLLAQGLRNNEISERLFLSGGTVKNYISNIYAKLEVKGTREAADKAKNEGSF